MRILNTKAMNEGKKAIDGLTSYLLHKMSDDKTVDAALDQRSGLMQVRNAAPVAQIKEWANERIKQLDNEIQNRKQKRK